VAEPVTKLTPTGCQQILRKLKRSPALGRGALAEHILKVWRDVLSKRKAQK
jgi:hypothetical protein